MKNKLPKKKQLKVDTEQEELASKEEEIEEEESAVKEDLNLLPRMLKKESLFVTFTGVIESGVFQ